ncbi:MAG: pyridoxamine 5'-phosphate oxidase family protein [Planctomycetota bacterium]|nr:MAG: pyridoxamine 5'-phosphate oxidase family protein [Planctomycetota bacterium]
MNLYDYFENTEGTGVLATADSNGNVDVAIYARPHITDEKTAAFIMNERLSYQNITSNPKAAYLFLEDAPGYNGKRLYLTKIKEDSDNELIDSMKRRIKKYKETDSKKHLVYFNIDRIRELIGE